MPRKSYANPRIELVEISPVEIVCQSMRGISSNADIDYGGGNNTPSRGNRRNIWAED